MLLIDETIQVYKIKDQMAPLTDDELLKAAKEYTSILLVRGTPNQLNRHFSTNARLDGQTRLKMGDLGTQHSFCQVKSNVFHIEVFYNHLIVWNFSLSFFSSQKDHVL